jgi:hypothetical protein
MTFDPDEALRILQDDGVDASLRGSFGGELLPDGLVVLSGTRLKTTPAPHRRNRAGM